MTVPYVSHAAPIHDGFCRCTTCKPSLVGERSSSLLRVKVAIGGMAAVAVLLAGAIR